MFVDLFSIYTVGKMEEYVIVMKMPVLERERESKNMWLSYLMSKVCERE